MLSGAMFIDGMAAKVLFERGYGDLIGIKSISGKKSRTSTNWIISAEEYHNLDFGGKERNYMSATLPGTWAIGQHFEILPSDNAQVISSIVDADTTRKLPAMLAFQNSLGGRVVIHAWDYEACIDTAFFNPLRRKQMQSAIRWLSHGKPALLFKSDGAYPLSFYRKAADGNLIIGAFNLTLDAWQESCFELAFDGKMPTPRILDEHGSWKQNDNLILALDNGVLQVKYNGKIDCKFPLIIKLII
jgi:hypothetical protein